MNPIIIFCIICQISLVLSYPRLEIPRHNHQEFTPTISTVTTAPQFVPSGPLLTPQTPLYTSDSSDVMQLYSHPWSLSDAFLSLDCVIRIDHLHPNDSMFIVFSSIDNTSTLSDPYNPQLSPQSSSSSSSLLSLPSDSASTTTIQSALHTTSSLSSSSQQTITHQLASSLTECPEGTVVTPFDRVVITPFVNRQSIGIEYETAVSPCGTKVDPFYIQWPQQITSTTDNWLNFRFFVPKGQHTSWTKARIQTAFLQFHQSQTLYAETSVSSRASLARAIHFSDIPTNQSDSRQFRSAFSITLEQLSYDVSSIDIGLHGNHQFTGTFRTCMVNNTRVSHATFLDLTYNLTINLVDGETYVLHCPDAYIQSRHLADFGSPTVLNIVGQIPTMIIANKFPSRSLLLEHLQLTPVPDYVTFWAIITGMFATALLCSVFISRLWNDDSNQDVIVLQTGT